MEWCMICFWTLVVWVILSEPWGFGIYRVLLYRFSLCETDYILLINGLKDLSQDTYFFTTGFHILFSDKMLPETQQFF